MYANGWRDDGNRILRVGPPVIDYGTGIQETFAIAAALLSKTKYREGTEY